MESFHAAIAAVVAVAAEDVGHTVFQKHVPFYGLQGELCGTEIRRINYWSPRTTRELEMLRNAGYTQIFPIRSSWSRLEIRPYDHLRQRPFWPPDCSTKREMKGPQVFKSQVQTETEFSINKFTFRPSSCPCTQNEPLCSFISPISNIWIALYSSILSFKMLGVWVKTFYCVRTG